MIGSLFASLSNPLALRLKKGPGRGMRSLGVRPRPAKSVAKDVAQTFNDGKLQDTASVVRPGE